jgi:hypothetical protein
MAPRYYCASGGGSTQFAARSRRPTTDASTKTAANRGPFSRTLPETCQVISLEPPRTPRAPRKCGEELNHDGTTGTTKC